MPACEKCWEDAGGDSERYRELLVERKDNPCTPEEHAGRNAKICPDCERRTVHQYAYRCVICGVVGELVDTRCWPFALAHKREYVEGGGDVSGGVRGH
jgi:hypothetical protein